jgi:hypothetical protein
LGAEALLTGLDLNTQTWDDNKLRKKEANKKGKRDDLILQEQSVEDIDGSVEVACAEYAMHPSRERSGDGLGPVLDRSYAKRA